MSVEQVVLPSGLRNLGILKTPRFQVLCSMAGQGRESVRWNTATKVGMRVVRRGGAVAR